MTRRITPRSGLVVTLIALALVASLALAARVEAEGDRGWQLRLYAAAVDFADSGDLGWGRTQYEAEVGAGLGVRVEYRISRRLGLDFGVLAGASAEFQSRTHPTLRVRDTITYTPVTFGVDLHLTPDRAFDLYLSPMLALVKYGGLVVELMDGGWTSRLGFDDDLGVGVAIGIGVPFGDRRWSFQAFLEHLVSEADGSDGFGFRVRSDQDATILGIGVGYTF